MANLASLDTMEETPDLSPAGERAKERAIELMDKLDRNKLTYHNTDHALYAYEMSKKLCKTEGINGKEKELLLLASLYHDVGYHVRYFKNEPDGAEMAVKELKEFGYSNEDTEIVKKIILATQLPQNPKTKLEQIICDSDLGVLGNDFWKWSELLRKELDIKDEREWYEKQLKFLESHNYFTDSAKKLLGPQKERYIGAIRTMLGVENA